MKSFLASNRTKALLGIGVLAIGIGAISKKVISYPAGGCMKGTQEMTLNWNKSILNKSFISWTLKKRIGMPNQALATNHLYKMYYRYSTSKAPLGYSSLKKL